MFKIRQILLMLALMSSCIAFTSNAATIKGYVYDKKTNEPIIGAIVTLSNRNGGVQTDFQGGFVLRNVEKGTDRLYIKSLGYVDYTCVITITDDNAEIDLGRIDMKKAKSKHYNRISLSYNPQLIPTIDQEQMLLYDSYGVIGGSASYLHGFNLYKSLALEIGANYNYTFNTIETESYHSQSQHHSVSLFANIAFNVSVGNVTISPYVGAFTRKYIYSKMCYENPERCVIYDMASDIEEKWFNPGVQAGLGFRYGKFYLGASLGCDLTQERNYFMEETPGNADEFYYEYSFSIGFEF